MVLGFAIAVDAWAGDRPATEKREVTVLDSVSMATTAGPGEGWDEHPRPYFSPDGKYFVVLVRRANVKNNTNDVSLLLYKTEDALNAPTPDSLVTMSSSASQYYAIRQLRWLDDNHTLVFLGQNLGEPQQIYEFDIRDRRLRKRTHHSTSIRSYDITGDGQSLAFIAEPPEQWPTPTSQEDTQEVIIEGQDLGNLLAGHHFQPACDEVYWEKTNAGPQRVPVDAGYCVPDFRISWSPGARYIVFAGLLRSLQFRKQWSGYQEPFFQRVFGSQAYKGRISSLFQYLLLDTKAGLLSSLLDAPANVPFDRFSWSKNGESLYLNSYLPLAGTDGTEREARKKSKFLTQIDLPSLGYRKINPENFPAQPVEKAPLEVAVEQDLNTPPKIYATDPDSRRKALLLDLNPQFAELDFGTVKTIEWSVDGMAVLGALYFPPDYSPEKRYPLVIQTHGLEPDQFSMDGRLEWSSAFAARPLAAKGILVLQCFHLKDPRDYQRFIHNRLGATDEESFLRFETLAYERAIDRLDEDRLIDRNRVGIIGFSRTVCYVGYTLTHSFYHFAAAMLVDGISCSYFEAIAAPEESRDVNFAIGDPLPFGPGLLDWVRNSPGFALDQVRSPVQLISLIDASVVSAWEWYIGLSLQNKPVDFVLLPDGNHIGIKPSQRMLTEQVVVDWFVYWLKGEKNPDPARSEQNARWQELRSLQTERQ